MQHMKETGKLSNSVHFPAQESIVYYCSTAHSHHTFINEFPDDLIALDSNGIDSSGECFFLAVLLFPQKISTNKKKVTFVSVSPRNTK